MFVAAARLTLILHGCTSLKEKRRLLHRARDRVRARFPGVAIAEVGDNDIWGRAEIGLASVGNDAVHTRQVVAAAVEHVESLHLGELVSDDIEVWQA